MSFLAISKENILKFTKLISMLIILYFGISFNVGLNELKEINLPVTNFTSNMFKPAFLDNKKDKSNSKHKKFQIKSIGITNMSQPISDIFVAINRSNLLPSNSKLFKKTQGIKGINVGNNKKSNSINNEVKKLNNKNNNNNEENRFNEKNTICIINKNNNNKIKKVKEAIIKQIESLKQNNINNINNVKTIKKQNPKRKSVKINKINKKNKKNGKNQKPKNKNCIKKNTIEFYQEDKDKLLYTVDTIISINNSVYFIFVFFLGACLNNKGIIKTGTL